MRHGAEPSIHVALVGGHLYLAVMRALLAGFVGMGCVLPDARIAEINGPIGVMRRRLRAWLDGRFLGGSGRP